ncbi:hypothetical protein NP233_g1159 [Leucocoprinus birnbaumii]|uniref:Uncharacterized protein n=1 Tax=Leucocoprinus birnbaumii TaxID=56174 RepID=A0AAD5W0V5_9AGAR|nr:hypothetical protein NP233_g1159 [Leucocoprinus birnbaumii]
MVILQSLQEPLRDLSPPDRDTFLRFGRGEDKPAPFSCIHHAFEYHASRQPEALAVVNFEETITYGELDRQANCLAARLRDMGIAPDSRVCLLVERSILMVVAILGVLKAGAAYVPLDGNVVSDSTLAHALRDSGSDIVLTLSKFTARVADKRAIVLEDVICRSAAIHCVKPKDEATTSGGAYVIYTSGTTGAPKGVDVSHQNVTNLLCLSPGSLHMAPGIRVSQLMNISFDMAAWEILGSMSNGSTLCLRGKSSKEWRSVMKLVDVVIATPSMLVPHDPADYPNIKVVAVAGEPCPKSLADAWATRVEFYHCCGPTEVTIVNTMQLHSPSSSLSIGRPVPNTSVYILDPETTEPLPIGSKGLMWAGGACVSRGYVNLPEKTAERYQLDPFSPGHSMMFNTGDLGRWNGDGTLEVLGRLDNQVKVKGFRVELDGVARAMEAFPGIHTAAALLINGELWGFVTPHFTTTEAIRETASKIQPYYAVPTNIIHLESFPKTANGKTDKRKLEELALSCLQQESVSVASDASSTKASSATPSSDHPELKTPPPAYIPASKSAHADRDSHSETDLGTEATIEVKEEVAWAGYEQDPIPVQTQGKRIRNLRHRIFTLYRRLFGIVFATNMGIFLWLCLSRADAQRIGGVVIINLFCAILMRQDYVINAIFNTCCAVPPSWPLAIRRVCGRVYHIGGLHSGFAVSGVVWLVLFTGQATKQLLRHDKITVPTLVLTYLILVLLLGIVLLAYPTFRSKQHNNFEMAHRFLGWSATVMVWCQFILLANDYKGSQELGAALVNDPHFWLLCVLTSSIILPWSRLRKVPVRSEVLSRHAVRMYFDYTTPIAGSFVRVSDDPLLEWHGFATVPEPGKKGFSLIVSRAGDWTAKQIDNPPSNLWVRGVPTFGVLRIVPLFRRLVFVATGSGIGPCAPCILEQRVPIRLLWTSPNVRETFGDDLVDSILEKSPGAVIYDTRKHGKPDMVKLTYRLVKEFNAEAVCIISNQKLTEKVVYVFSDPGPMTHLPPHSTVPYKRIGENDVYFDIYPPIVTVEDDSTPTRSVPAVIYFHGGGLTVGNRESWFPSWLYRRAVALGLAFLCPDYQLLPPATGHDVATDIQDFLSFISFQNLTFSVPGEGLGHQNTFRINPDALILAGSSAGGLCAYLGADARPKPRALLSLYGMGGDFLTPYWMEPKQEVFIPGREILDPEHFQQFVYPLSPTTTTESSLEYYPTGHPTPGLPSNPRMYLARLFCQLGTYLDYYTGEHEPSLSKTLREGRRVVLGLSKGGTLQLEPESWGGHLVPERHRPLFPQLSVTAQWPEVFLIHGTEDYHVHIHESLHLKKLLEEANVRVTLKVVEGKGHSFDYDSDAEDEFHALFDEVSEFLTRVLKMPQSQ